MRTYFYLLLCLPFFTDGQNVGIGTPTPQQMLDVAGAIRVGNTTTGVNGSIRFDGSKFEGYNGSSWDPFTFLPAGTIVASNINPNTALSNAGFTYSSTALITRSLPTTTTTNSWLATSTIAAPEERSSHRMAWTGSKMAVWGGTADGVYLNTGALYDPVTDSWSAMAASPLSARAFHSMIWTGTEIIIWGGSNSGGNLADGARYNPATNTWTPMSTTNAPTGRSSHTVVWTGSEMITWGGITSGGATNTGARYNPASNTWTTMSTTNAPTSRYLHVAVWTGSIMIVYGGIITGNATDNGRYNPATNTWNATPMSTPSAIRISTAAAWTGTEMLVWGGTQQVGGFSTAGEKYNPVSNIWTPMSTTNAPQARFDHGYAWTGSELIVFGGNGAGTTDYTRLNDGGRYNPSSNTWMALPKKNAPLGRAVNRAVWTGNMMVTWGGYDQQGSPLNTGGRYIINSESGVVAESQMPLYLFTKN